MASVLSSLQSILLSLKQLITASYHKLPSVSPTTQLAQISGAGSPTPGGLGQAGLVAHYTFDEGSGTTAVDSSWSNTGTLQNGTTWTSGKVGNGTLQLDGVYRWNLDRIVSF